MIDCFVALGSNLSSPASQVKRAIKAISQFPQTQLCQASSLYQTKPVGLIEQPDFVNAVIHIKTQMAPFDLLEQLLKLELKHKRVRLENQAWGPRTLDCDILLYGDIKLNTATLTLPHPRMHQRGFVLWPLYEIAPYLILNNIGIDEYIKNLEPLHKMADQEVVVNEY